MHKGKQINNTVKKIICNVYDYFENESKKCKGSIMKLGKKTAEATGYCKWTVERVITEKRRLDGTEFTWPAKW